MKDLAALSTKDLIAEYNSCSGKAPITAWKRKVDDLRAFLLMKRPDLYFLERTPKPSERMTDFEAPADELVAQSGRPVDHQDPPAKAKPAKKAARKAGADGIERGAIRQYCEELLLRTKGTDPETKRPLGLSYSSILEQVEKKFPTAATSLNCLRWYATKMNKRTGKEKVVMPVRAKAVAA
jgi:hypothetical protein